MWSALDHQGKKKRDDYSYQELLPVRDVIMARATEYREIEAKDRDSLQTQMVSLADNIQEYEIARHAWTSLAYRVTPRTDAFRALMGESANGSFVIAELIERGPRMVQAFIAAHGTEHEPVDPAQIQSNQLVQVLGQMQEYVGHGAHPWIPPESPDEPEWRSIGDLIEVGALTRGGMVEQRALDPTGPDAGRL